MIYEALIKNNQNIENKLVSLSEYPHPPPPKTPHNLLEKCNKTKVSYCFGLRYSPHVSFLNRCI